MTEDDQTLALPIGTEVRVHNPASAFHGRRAVVLGYVWPTKARSPVLLRLLPADDEWERGGHL